MSLNLFESNVLINPLENKEVDETQIEEQKEQEQENISSQEQEYSSESMTDTSPDIDEPNEIEDLESTLSTENLAQGYQQPDPQNWYVHSEKHIDSDENETSSYYRIYLFDMDCSPDQKHISNILKILNQANDDDKIDIYITSRLPSTPGKTILSAVEQCKAHITTITDACIDFLSLVLWLQGDELIYSEISNCRCLISEDISMGSPVDLKIATAHHIQFVEALLQFIVDTGFMTDKEKKQIIEDKTCFFSYGEDFSRRAKRVISTRKKAQKTVEKTTEKED